MHFLVKFELIISTIAILIKQCKIFRFIMQIAPLT